MSIEIKLTGEDAEKYLEQQAPDTSALAIALQSATQYIDFLEKEKKDKEQPVIHTNLDNPKRHNIAGDMNKPAHHQKHEETVITSNRILKDAKIAEELEPVITNTNLRWSEQEIKVIKYAMDRPETELNRTLAALCEKLARTEGAIRSKLAEMSIYVNAGVLYYK